MMDFEPGHLEKFLKDTLPGLQGGMRLDRKSADELASAEFRPIIHSGGKCLDVTGGASANGTKVRGWECNGADAQLWRLDAQRRLVSKNGKCLDAWGTNYDAKKNGIPLTVWDCHDGKNQKWRFDGPYFTADNGMNLDLNLENGILHLWEAFTHPTSTGCSATRSPLEGRATTSPPPALLCAPNLEVPSGKPGQTWELGRGTSSGVVVGAQLRRDGSWPKWFPVRRVQERMVDFRLSGCP